jgi:hypothetical protein
VWDVFKDQDEFVTDQNIRPLKWFSADMMIMFFDYSYEPQMKKFWEWWDTKGNYLSNLGLIKHDKKLAIGHIPVATLVTNLTRQEVLTQISKFDTINRVY